MSQNKDKTGSALGDILKKVVSVGIGAAFLTEDALKNILKDAPIPKDIINGILQNAKNAKSDFTQNLQDEFKKYLSRIEIENIIESILEKYDIEVTAKFSFKRKRKRRRNSPDSNEPKKNH